MEASANHQGSMESDLSSSLSLDSTPRDHTPKKLHQFPAKDVAMELTLMDSELLRSIRPEELKDAAWTRKERKVNKVIRTTTVEPPNKGHSERGQDSRQRTNQKCPDMLSWELRACPRGPEVFE